MKLHEKFLAINDELGQQFYERDEAIEAICLGLLAGKNVYLLGDPGTAKSMLVDAYGKRVTGANYKYILLDRQLPLESIFGPLDILEFRNTGHYHRAVDGYAPTAHFLVLDEVGKAGPAVLNPLLTLLNERIYVNNSTPMQCNLRVAVGASNEELEPELAAMWDRWMLRLVIEGIKEPSNFASLISKGLTTIDKPTTVTLDEVDTAVTEVAQVIVPPGVVDKILELKADLENEQITPSDRRWRQAMDVVRASAWLYGRTEADEDDLLVLRHILWDVAEQIPKAEEHVLKHASEFSGKVLGFERELDEIEAQLAALTGQSIQDRSAYGGKAQAQLTSIASGLEDLREKAARQGRNTSKIERTRDRAQQVRKRMFVVCLDVPEDRAANL